MHRSVAVMLVAAVIVTGAARPATAQEMRPGIWRGWLQQADQDSIRVSFAVDQAGRHLLITLRGRGGITYDMSGAKVKNDVLTFDWAMGLGSFLYCRLTRRDGRSFEGTCNDRTPGATGNGVAVWMMMTPPDSA